MSIYLTESLQLLPDVANLPKKQEKIFSQEKIPSRNKIQKTSRENKDFTAYKPVRNQFPKTFAILTFFFCVIFLKYITCSFWKYSAIRYVQFVFLKKNITCNSGRPLKLIVLWQKIILDLTSWMSPQSLLFTSQYNIHCLYLECDFYVWDMFIFTHELWLLTSL